MNLNNLLKIGKVVNTFGTKGTVKFLIDEELEFSNKSIDIDILFYKNNVDAFIPLKVESINFDRKTIQLKFEGIDNINQAEKLKNYDLYFVNQNKIFKKVNQYLSYQVIEESKQGKIIDLMNNSKQTLIKIQFEDEKAFWLPIVNLYVKEINDDKQVIEIQNAKGLR